jgi:hypothetical protein
MAKKIHQGILNLRGVDESSFLWLLVQIFQGNMDKYSIKDLNAPTMFIE